jgi:hypothetical protein
MRRLREEIDRRGTLDRVAAADQGMQVARQGCRVARDVDDPTWRAFEQRLAHLWVTPAPRRVENDRVEIAFETVQHRFGATDNEAHI